MNTKKLLVVLLTLAITAEITDVNIFASETAQEQIQRFQTETIQEMVKQNLTKTEITNLESNVIEKEGQVRRKQEEKNKTEENKEIVNKTIENKTVGNQTIGSKEEIKEQKTVEKSIIENKTTVNKTENTKITEVKNRAAVNKTIEITEQKITETKIQTETKTETKAQTKTKAEEVIKSKEKATKENISYSKEDLMYLTAIIYCESGNQSYKGKVAVANVILNRITSTLFDHVTTIKEAIYDKRWGRQFSPAYTKKNGKWTTKGTPLEKALNLYKSGKYASTGQKKQMEESKKAAKAALEGSRIVSEKVLYFNAHIKSTKAKCKRQGIPYFIIQDHIFY